MTGERAVLASMYCRKCGYQLAQTALRLTDADTLGSFMIQGRGAKTTIRLASPLPDQLTASVNYLRDRRQYINADARHLSTADFVHLSAFKQARELGLIHTESPEQGRTNSQPRFLQRHRAVLLPSALLALAAVPDAVEHVQHRVDQRQVIGPDAGLEVPPPRALGAQACPRQVS